MRDKLTKSDIRKMEEEIEYRKLTLRKELLEQVKETRAHGDLSENFEYHAAKREKNKNESRIRYLERMIRTAEVISDESGEDEAGINDLVTVYFEDDDAEEQYKIVTTVRSDSLSNLISIESPMGKALLGHKESERVLVKVNDAVSYSVQIRAIDKNQDDAQDRIRSY
ncbi:MAG: transcription elongation factor GreA [Lachnospiraceae bacterium]|nr:transcription elongation factor GreA [Lachnospiraceae bacterium]